MHPWENAKSPWLRVHLDFAGPYLGKMFLVLVDSYSKWLDVTPMSNTKTTLLVECLRHSFVTHGLPFAIVTDNRPSFTSNEFKAFVQKNGIKHIFTAPCHPSSNGMAEPPVQTFKSAIKKIAEGKNEMELNTIINRYLLHYRATPQSATEKYPAEMLFNCKLNARLNLLKQSMNKQDLNCEQQIVEFYASETLRTFYPKDLVWYRNYQLGNK